MKSPIKKYAILSIIINVISLVIYFCFFHSKQTFKGERDISTTINTANTTFLKSNTRTVDRAIYYLDKKPKLKLSVAKVFEENEFILSSFVCFKDSLLRADNISMKEYSIILEKYNYALSRLQNCFGQGMHDSQREAKMRDSEIEEKIAYFNRNSIIGISLKDLKRLSKQELKTVLTAMENHLILIQNMSNNEFASMTGRGCVFFSKYFPIVLNASNYELNIGETRKADIGVGVFASSYASHFSVTLDGEKIDMSDGRYEFEIEADSLGKQQIEASIYWLNPFTNEIGKDTSYFEYTVIR